jgi:predicted HicB family RNase H-like nuclease
MKTSDRYLKIVEWSEEDNCYVGHCPGLLLGGVHGHDEAKVYAELCRTVDEVIGLYQKDRKPLPSSTISKQFSGKFILRLDKEIHHLLAIRALEAGISLNRYCQKILAVAVKPRFRKSA